jgi:hypothetical protein
MKKRGVDVSSCKKCSVSNQNLTLQQQMNGNPRELGKAGNNSKGSHLEGCVTTSLSDLFLTIQDSMVVSSSRVNSQMENIRHCDP